VTVWRIARRQHVALDGEGARLYGSRWTPRGLPAVFASATLSLAALEYFVHTDLDLEPADLVAVEIGIAASIRVESLAASALPAKWRKYPAPAALASIGGNWLRASRTVALVVPSVVIPREQNIIINPKHVDLEKLRVGSPEAFGFDARMWKARG
jgi:RES domain-containing protein